MNSRTGEEVSSPSTALILVNLGTPATPAPGDVRRFLRAFLSDRRVVDLPRWFWLPLLYGVILPFRSKKVSHLYKSIWLPEGSPLAVITREQVECLQERYSHQQQGKITVFDAMVYGQPALEKRLQQSIEAGIKQVVVLPLYPQFCSATTGSVCDQFNALKRRYRSELKLRLIKSYHDNDKYINALVGSLNAHWKVHGKPEKLLFSFHGIPQKLADSGDPYFQQCYETAELVAARAQLPEQHWQVCFQSRFGKAEWVKPYSDMEVEKLAKSGIKRIDMIAPSFSADCLETLEELAIQHKELFKQNGGEDFYLVPCLNASAPHIDMMKSLFETVLSRKLCDL